MSGIELLRVVITTEPDVFAVRRQGRQIGEALGLEGQDQIRIAAALSEVGRRLLAGLGPVLLEVALVTSTNEVTTAPEGRERPTVSFRATAAGGADDALVEAVALTRPLMDHWRIQRSDASTTVTMARELPVRAAGLTADEIEKIRVSVGALTAGSPMEELAEHNRQLLTTLEQVQARRDELARLNAELTETNKGVVALYTELSEELAATNRGVVALYAELDQRTDQLRAASEAKSRFLANVSHELRAPIIAVVGLVRLLRDPTSASLTPEQVTQLELIDDSARGLLGLVNELLDLAKAESGRLEPVVERTSLKDIFDTLRETMRVVPRAEATTLVVVEPVGLGPIATDPIMLTQVLRNLLTNGLKFTPRGEVRLCAEFREDGWLALTVADTGIGIPAAEHERIFEEFHQVRHPIQVSVTGTGLGLAYARRLVHILGGTISVASTPGEGSTFTVLMPREPATPGAGDE
jgi:signal transduction histidine kinase